METVQLILNISAIVANIAIVSSMIIALRQLFVMKKTLNEEHTRNLRQSTIEFYNEINKETKDFIDEVILKEIDLSDPNIIYQNEALHKKVRRYLSLMERFSVGIHSHIYDIVIFDRIQGDTTLIMYNLLKPYIESESERYGSYFYGEYIKLVSEIEKIRTERRKSGYSDNTEEFPVYVKLKG